MKKRKILRFASIVLAAAMLMTLAGCGDQKTSSGTVDYSVGLNDDGTLKDINPADYVTIAEYKTIEIPQDEIAVSDEDLQEAVDNLLSQYPETVQVTDRAVADGDSVNIDYVGSVDGEEFEGGSTNGAGTTVTIGETQYIDDFLEQLIGHKPGETFDINVTFPDDYGQENLNGKDAVFKTTINYIEESNTPELTDAFVTENLQETYGYTSAADTKAKLTEELKSVNTENYIYDYMLEKSEFKELPKDVVEEQMDLRVQAIEQQMEYSGIAMEDYLKEYDFEDEDAFRESFREDCEELVKMYMICQIVYENENLEVTDDDLQEIFGTEDISEMVEYYGEGYTNRIGMNNVALDYLLENVTIK